MNGVRTGRGTLDPKRHIYPAEQTLPRNVLRAAFVIALIAIVATLLVVYLSWGTEDDRTALLYCTIGLWAIVPPLWFWFEYFWLYRRYGEPDTVELFKYGQDLSKAIWAGGLAALIAFAASDAVRS
jgi:Na+/melibiose symporter-like transporter